MKWVVPLLLAALAVIQFAAAAEDSSAGILSGLPACAVRNEESLRLYQATNGLTRSVELMS